MSIYKPQSVEIEPNVILEQWGVFQINKGKKTRHLFGKKTNGSIHDGRVSSAIVKFNKKKKIVTTKSGRTYKLEGPPGFCGDAEYVQAIWLSINGLTLKDINYVTKEYD